MLVGNVALTQSTISSFTPSILGAKKWPHIIEPPPLGGAGRRVLYPGKRTLPTDPINPPFKDNNLGDIAHMQTSMRVAAAAATPVDNGVPRSPF